MKNLPTAKIVLTLHFLLTILSKYKLFYVNLKVVCVFCTNKRKFTLKTLR